MFFCKLHFEGCEYHFEKDKILFRELVSFSGWSLLGQSAVVAAGQGDSFFVNRFFSVTANAAMGVSSQLTGAIETFITNFQVAFNPQLVKSYANEDKTEHCRLLYRASKFSFYLQLVLTIPIVFNISAVLHFWLEDPPKYSDLFCVLVLCGYLIASISIPLKTSIYACGRIRDYEISRAILFALGLCSSFLVLWTGNPPYFVAIVGVFVQLFLLAIRAFFAKRDSGINIAVFFRVVIIPCILVGALALVVPFFTAINSNSFISLLSAILIDVLYIVVIIYVFGLTKNERKTIIVGIRNKIFARL